MIARFARGASFVRAGLLGPTLKRMVEGKRKWPKAPVLGQEITLPWTSIDEGYCFGCSKQNPRGLKLTFREAEGWDLGCAWSPDRTATNYPGMAHGGLVVTVLDELVGQAVFHKTRHFPVSIEGNIRWYKPVRIGDDLIAAARINGSFDGTYAASAFLFRSDGRAAAEYVARYYTPSLEQFQKMAELSSVPPEVHPWFAPRKSRG